MHYFKKTMLSLSLLFSLFLSGQAMAQSLSPADSLNISYNPQAPKAGEFIDVKLTSYVVDLGMSYITWYLDNKIVRQGKGATEISFKTGAVGRTHVIRAVAEDPKKGTVSDEMLIRPAEVDLLWETDTYVPPLYKGKKMPSNYNPITVFAVPFIIDERGTKVRAGDLRFKWELNNTPQSRASGLGKNTFVIESIPIFLGSAVVDVEITTEDKSYIAQGRATITPYKTKLLIYEESPTLGTLYHREIGKEFRLTRTEGSVRAIPLYFSVPPKDDTLVYSWGINGRALPTRSNMLTFRAIEGEQGKSNISITVANRERMLEYHSRTFSVLYE